MHPGLTPCELAAVQQGAWFASLDPCLQSALIRNGRVLRLARGSRHLALGGSLCAVAGGAAKLSRRMASGRGLGIDLFGPGVWFAGAGGVGADRAAHAVGSYHVEGRGPLVLLVVEDRELGALMAMHPGLTHALLGLRDGLLRRLGEMLEERNDLTLADRISRQLGALSERFGVAGSQGIRFSVPVSQQDLADLTGACRQRVNMEIKEFERQGVLRMVRGALELRPGAVA